MALVYFFLSFMPAAVSLILQIAAGFLWQIFLTEGIVRSTEGSILFYHILGVCVFGFWYLAAGKETSGRELIKKVKESVKKCSILEIGRILLAGILLCVLGNSMVGAEQFLMPSLVEQYLGMMENAGMGTNVYAIVASVVFAPIGEELLCRGITLSYAKKATKSFRIANLLQAFIFGLIHGNVIQGLYAFVIGLFLGYAVEKYDSLMPAMLLHVTVNFSSTFLLAGLLSRIPDTLISYGICFFLSFAGAFLLLAKTPGKEKRS